MGININTPQASALRTEVERKFGNWLQPDRICEVEYIGENRFVAVYTENSSIRPDDSFSCLQIQKGRELYMDCFARSCEEVCNSTNRYVVGQISGITIIEIVEAAGIPVQE